MIIWGFEGFFYINLPSPLAEEQYDDRYKKYAEEECESCLDRTHLTCIVQDPSRD
jgi:hypothetical protein